MASLECPFDGCQRAFHNRLGLCEHAIAKHNAAVYGVEDRIEFVLGDFFHVAKDLRADAVFLSPPWGGPEYLKEPVFKLKVRHRVTGMVNYCTYLLRVLC